MFWHQTPIPTCAKRKRVLDHDDEMMNSSLQIPSYARITNHRVKQSGSAHLLTLPAGVRMHIFRVALVEHEPIAVNAKNTQASKEPGLLTVSHDVREEALKVFYVENGFEMMVHGYGAAALLPWLRKINGHRVKRVCASGTDASATDKGSSLKGKVYQGFDISHLSPNQAWLLEKQLIYHSASTTLTTAPTCPGELTWTIPHEPNFTNLVAWLKLFHAGQLPGPPRDVEGMDTRQVMAFAVFDVVDGLKGENWELVEKILPGLKATLGAMEREWMDY